MMKRFAILAAVVALIGCTQNDEGLDNITSTPEKSQTEFYATMPECNTRTYVEDNKYLRWNAGDDITVFNGNSYNSHWQFAGEDGANSGKFNEISEGGFVTGTPLDLTANYAIYPYDENISISEAGVVSLTLPAVQEYNHTYANSFGTGANTMMAVTKNTSDNFLSFKNLCGYLKLKFYGNDVTVKSITVKGNNGEKIAGKATVSMAYGGEPTITMGDDATDTITIDCGEGVALSNDAANPTTFWVVIPEITFEDGITINVTDINDQTFEKKTTNAVPIENNLIQPMATLDAEFGPTEIPETWKIYYTATTKIEIDSWNEDTFGANIESNEWNETTSQGVITFDGEVTKIGTYAFAQTNITSVTIPATVSLLERYAFWYCGELKEVRCNAIVPPATGDFPGGYEEYWDAFVKNSSGRVIYVPEESYYAYITAKGWRYYGYTILKPSEVLSDKQRIDNRMMWYTTSDNSANGFWWDSSYWGGASVVFNGYDKENNMGFLVFDKALTEIGNDGFGNYASDITTLTIPKSVNKISSHQLYLCSIEAYYGPLATADNKSIILGTTLVSYAKENTATSYVIPDSITTIAISAFANAHNLTNITVPDSVVEIGGCAFNNTNIVDIVLNGVERIGDQVFGNSSKLRSVTMGGNTKSIGFWAFVNCPNLKEIYCKATTPPTIVPDVNGDDRLFGGSSFGGYIYVPDSSYWEYKYEAEDWSDYSSYIRSYY